MSTNWEVPTPFEGPALVNWCRQILRGFLLTLLYLFVVNVRLADMLTLNEAKNSASSLPATPCWQREQFVVAGECKKCTLFEVKTIFACVKTGFAMKIDCPTSQREEYKSCRSASMEETLFWRFEGTVISLAAVFAALVVLRQRALDRLASEKVRKQIESI
ncbi:protein JTB [Narcine bancroftii]|uniref:protein JTB n=1 Tax=Narcine bancroftii TaxID=1343680 RepID=UPI003831CEE9